VDERVRTEADRAAACLLAGGVVLLPTDTVYGLAVHPERDEAITRLFAMKGRPRSVNLPVMISSRDDIVALGGVVTTSAELLLESKYVPGPLTLALELSPADAPPWLRGRDECAVRMPADDRLIAIIKPENTPSQRVAAKIGLQLEKQSIVHGEDCVIYAGTL